MYRVGFGLELNILHHAPLSPSDESALGGHTSSATQSLNRLLEQTRYVSTKYLQCSLVSILLASSVILGGCSGEVNSRVNHIINGYTFPAECWDLFTGLDRVGYTNEANSHPYGDLYQQVHFNDACKRAGYKEPEVFGPLPTVTPSVP